MMMKLVEKKYLEEKKESLESALKYYRKNDKDNAVMIDMCDFSIYSIELLLKKIHYNYKDVDIYKCDKLEEYYIVEKGQNPNFINHIYFLEMNDVQGYVLFRRNQNGKHLMVVG